MPRPISGSRLAPKMMMTMARMTTNSGNPIRPMVKLLALLADQKPPCCTRKSQLDCTTTRPRRRNGHLVGFLMFGALVAGGRAAPQFTSGVDLVEVYATVSDARGEPVADL